MLIFPFIVLFFMLYSDCGKKTEILSPDQQVTRLQFSLDGVNDPGSDAKYSMWAAYDSAKVPLTKFIGDFTIDGQGNATPNAFDVKLGTVQKTTTFVTSVEHADSTPQEASTYKILAAKLVANSGTFAVGDEYLLDFDESMATGSYQVIQANGSDSVKGIWFMIGDTAKEAGLGLPEAAAGWTYAGYVRINGSTYSTGDFYNPAAPDAGNPYNLSLPTFPFPGENYEINPADSTKLNLDLRGAQVMIKITPPLPSFAETPYDLIMFEGTIPLDATENVIYQLDNTSESFPHGNAQLIIKMFE